jgi:DNA-directed RNA polymerase specialized sigma24 family protein
MLRTDPPEIDKLLALGGEGDREAVRSLMPLLSQLDAEQGRIVELRFFGGHSIELTAKVLGRSPATVKRDWSTARIWLYQQLNAEARA